MSMTTEVLHEEKLNCRKRSRYSVLVVGDKGVGKSTLINNLLSENDIASEGHTIERQTLNIEKYEGGIRGVPVVFYDTPGLGSLRSSEKDHYLKVKATMEKETFDVVIYCMKMSETRMHQELIDTFKNYNELGIDWSHTVIALTFADSVSVPWEVRQDSNFIMSHFFEQKLRHWRDMIRSKLVSEVGLRMEDAQKLKIDPTTRHYKEHLPNDQEWLFQFWKNVIEAMPHTVIDNFLEVHKRAQHSSDVLKLLESAEFESAKALQVRHVSQTAVSPNTTHGNIRTLTKTVMVGATIATLSLLTCLLLDIASACSAPILFSVAAIGVSAAAFTKWLGWW